ncbi:MAG TPA: bifunctional riboflavin kinase/FAD synthetase [Burkholderiales bacterium]|nr:bifunctional riboflavin kinase/FAD synthetase [Burkholderiales bacterium]
MPVRGAHALTIGNFDGVHLGHQAMLERVVAQARARGLQSCALTFEPHPREFFAPDAAPARLSRLREKLELIAATGIDHVHIARFDASFASLSPQHFVEQVLVRGLRIAWLLVGRDFRYGARRAGDFAALERAAREHGFVLEAMPEVRLGGERISSSAVREALLAADFRRAERLLGRPYALSGRVAHGAKLGRKLGFATANLMLPRRAPLAGIYVVEACGADARDGARWLPGVASVGRRPTVNEVAVPLLEVHLFDFAEELYGRHLRVRFIERLRDEAKYPDLDTLRAAIARDVAQAREFFAKHG